MFKLQSAVDFIPLYIISKSFEVCSLLHDSCFKTLELKTEKSIWKLAILFWCHQKLCWMVTMGLNSVCHMWHWAFSEQIPSYLTVLHIQLHCHWERWMTNRKGMKTLSAAQHFKINHMMIYIKINEIPNFNKTQKYFLHHPTERDIFNLSLGQRPAYLVKVQHHNRVSILGLHSLHILRHL